MSVLLVQLFQYSAISQVFIIIIFFIAFLPWVPLTNQLLWPGFTDRA